MLSAILWIFFCVVFIKRGFAIDRFRVELYAKCKTRKELIGFARLPGSLTMLFQPWRPLKSFLPEE